MFKLYVLRDPRTREIRYIGTTSSTLSQRLKQHLCDKTITHKTKWIKQLKNNSLIPLIEETACFTTREEMLQHEIRLIRILRILGYRLTNTTKGGEGCSRPTSEETKEKLRAHNLGKKQTLETINKRCQKLRGMKRDAKFRRELSARKLGVKPSKENIEKIIKANTGRLPHNCISLECSDGRVFHSILDASKALGISISGIQKYLQGKKLKLRKDCNLTLTKKEKFNEKR